MTVKIPNAKNANTKPYAKQMYFFKKCAIIIVALKGLVVL